MSATYTCGNNKCRQKNKPTSFMALHPGKKIWTRCPNCNANNLVKDGQVLETEVKESNGN